MKNDEKIRGQEIKTILYLMLLFLPLSSILNLLNERVYFTFLYLIATLFTIIIYIQFNKKKDNNSISKYILTLLFLMFFSYLFLGNQKSFDIFWVLLLPMITIMIETYEQTKKWLFRFIALLLTSLSLSYSNLEIISYDSFALWSLLWAGIFVSYMSLHYKKTQNTLESEIHDYQSNLEEKVHLATRKIQNLNIDLEETQKEIIQRLGTLGEFRSNETGAHVIRVGLYSKKLAKLLGLNDELCEQIYLTAPLHDIGKVGIEDSILNKPGKLTVKEYEIMKKHAQIGESILKESNKPLIKMASEIAGGHHEKYDGTGYPKGLKAESIPLSARIVAIADVFDALYSKRAYKSSWSLEKIIEFFKENKGTHFDPKLVTLFLDNINEFTKIYNTNR